jgi:hypothetical protein
VPKKLDKNCEKNREKVKNKPPYNCRPRLKKADKIKKCEQASNDQHYDGFWSVFRVNLLNIKPLHNALRWDFGTLRPL